MSRIWQNMGSGLASAFLQSPVLTAMPTMHLEPSPGAWSPDGKYVAFIWARDGINQLWAIPSTGGWPLQLTDVSLNVTVGTNTLYDRRLTARPDWSPRGHQIAFTAIYGDEKESSLWVVSLDGGGPRRLTHHAGSDRTPSWSPDGSQIAFVCLRDSVDDLWLVATQGGAPTQLTYNRFNDVDPSWSPDGKTILFSSQRGEDYFCQEICTVPSAGGRESVLTTYESDSDRYPRWAPDGQHIYFISDRSGYDEIWRMDVNGDNAVQMTPRTNQDKGEFSVSPDGKWLAYESIRRSNIDILAISTADKEAEPVRVTSGNGVNTVPTWSATGTTLLYKHSSPTEAAELWTVDFSLQNHRLTHTMVGFLDDVDLIEPEQVYFSGFGGRDIDALLYRPRELEPGKHYPALLLIHGGPNGQHLNTWWPYLQYLVSQGYLVLAPNCHGSMGYGREFCDANLMDWAGKDMQDWALAVEYLKGLGYVDGERIAIWGRSYGGYATLMGITHLPDLFKAGVCHFGPSNLLTFWDQTSVRYLMKRLMGMPLEHRDLYLERSATPYAADVKAPVLILQGEKDDGVPPSQSEEMAEALEQAGKVYEYQCYPGEGHGFLKPDHVRDASIRIETFLQKYLNSDS